MGQETVEDLQALLEAPFPREAMSKDSSRGFDLTSIKAQWVVDRLNNVFGIFGWDFKPSFEQSANHVLCHGVLTVRQTISTFQQETSDHPLSSATQETFLREVAQTGSHEIRKNIGDAYKSASTDCLGKAASWLGIGNDVFKGNIDPRTLAPKANTSAQAAPQNKPQPINMGADPGNWSVSFGKYKGQIMNDIQPAELENYAAFLMKDKTTEEIKAFTGGAKEFLVRLKALKALSVGE